MNWARTIMSLFIFYGLLAFIISSVGETISEEPGLREAIDFQHIDLDAYNNDNEVQSYSDLLQSQAQLMGMDTFQFGEYHLSNVIDIDRVYLLNKSIDVSGYWQKRLSGWDWVNPFNWASAAPSNELKNRWESKYGTQDKFAEGETVYAYPYIKIRPDKYWHFNTWVVGGIFDAHSGVNQWTDTYSKKITMTGKGYDCILRLDFGKQGHYTRYYVIDVIYTDIDLTGWSPNEIMDYFAAEGKAQYIERYGGAIQGEDTSDIPASIASHTLGKTSDSGFQRFMSSLSTGYEAFKGYGVVSTLLEIVIFAPIGVLISYIVYVEGRSWIPFIRGG